jgi:hypothetical protein
MDFKDMKEQFAEKAKEELMGKVDEAKQDIEKRFGGSEQQSSENRSGLQQDRGSGNSEDAMREEQSNIPVSSDDKVESTILDKDEDAA